MRGKWPGIQLWLLPRSFECSGMLWLRAWCCDVSVYAGSVIHCDFPTSEKELRISSELAGHFGCNAVPHGVHCYDDATGVQLSTRAG
eukprot:1232518-Amphidinium_carterae.1